MSKNKDIVYNPIGEERLNFIITYNQLCSNSIEGSINALNAIDEQVTAIIGGKGGVPDELICALKIFYMYFFTHCTTEELINALDKRYPYGMPRCLLIALNIFTQEIMERFKSLTPAQEYNVHSLVEYIMHVNDVSDTVVLSFCYIDNPENVDQISLARASMATEASYLAMENAITSSVALMFLLNASLIISGVENGTYIKTGFITADGEIIRLTNDDFKNISDENVICREATCKFINKDYPCVGITDGEGSLMEFCKKAEKEET